MQETESIRWGGRRNLRAGAFALYSFAKTSDSFSESDSQDFASNYYSPYIGSASIGVKS